MIGNGETVGGYRIVRRIGVGGMGEEWHSPTNALDRFFMVGVEMR